MLTNQWVKITLIIFGSYHPEPPNALSRGLGHRRVGCIHGPTSRKEKDNNALGLGDYRDAELKGGFEAAKWLDVTNLFTRRGRRPFHSDSSA